MRHAFAYLACGALVHPLSGIRRGASLRCATCDGAVVLRQSKGVPGRRYVRPHFALKSAGGGGGGGACSGGGGAESEAHLTAKDILIHRLHDLRVNIPECAGCGKTRTLSLQPAEFGARLERRVGGLGRLRFDVVVTEGGRDAGVIEVCHTHPTDRPKVAAVLARGLWYAEYRAADVMHADEATPDGEGMRLASIAPPDWVAGAPCPACVARRERQQREAAAAAAAAQERLALARRASDMSGDEVAAAGPRVVDAWGARLARRIDEYALMRALGHESAARPPAAPRAKYTRGFWKCTSGCGWFPPGDLSVVERGDGGMTCADFDGYESRVPCKYQNGAIRLCGRCAVACEMCGRPFPRARAKLYGLCLGCNVECKKMRTALDKLREEPLGALALGGVDFPEHEAIVVRRYVDGTRARACEQRAPVRPPPRPAGSAASPGGAPTGASGAAGARAAGASGAPARGDDAAPAPERPRAVDALQMLMQSQERRRATPLRKRPATGKRALGARDARGSLLLFNRAGKLICIDGAPPRAPVDDPVASLAP